MIARDAPAPAPESFDLESVTLSALLDAAVTKALLDERIPPSRVIR